MGNNPHSRRNVMVGKRDENEGGIIAEMESRGVTVRKIAQKDLPDLNCDYMGIFFEVEVKMPGCGLRSGQDDYFVAARSRNLPVFVVDHIDDVPAMLAMVKTWYA